MKPVGFDSSGTAGTVCVKAANASASIVWAPPTAVPANCAVTRSMALAVLL